MQRRAGLIVSVIAVLSAPAGLGPTGNATHAKGERQGAIAGTLWMIGGPAPGHRVLRNTGIRVLAANRVVASTTTDGRGRFHVTLAPGRYRLALTNGSLLLPRHVDVATSQTARIRLTLSVK
jgi:hypothetical protein